MNRVARALAAAAAVAVMTSGCSMIPGMGGAQSGVQACSAISDTIQRAATTFSTALGQVGTDPDAAAKALQDFTDSLTAARGKITNADVGAALDKLNAAVAKLQTLVKSAGTSGADSDAVSKATEDVSTALSDLATACTKI